MTAVVETQPGAADADRPGIDVLAIAKALMAQGALRQRLFDGFLRQPSWDMLLCLYVALQERAKLTRKEVCAASGEPSALADIWLRKMEQIGLVTRRNGPQDARDTVVEISEEAASAIEGLLQDLAAGIHLSDSDAERALRH